MPLSAEVALRRAGKLNFRTSVFDLSPHGCRIQFVERPSLEERVWVKFDGLKAGLAFAIPIHAAVFEQLLARLT